MNSHSGYSQSGYATCYLYNKYQYSILNNRYQVHNNPNSIYCFTRLYDKIQYASIEIHKYDLNSCLAQEYNKITISNKLHDNTQDYSCNVTKYRLKIRHCILVTYYTKLWMSEQYNYISFFIYCYNTTTFS